MLIMVRSRIALAYFSDPAKQDMVRNSLVPLGIAEARFAMAERWKAQLPALGGVEEDGKTLCVILTPSDEALILASLLESDALRVEIHDIEA